MPKGWEKEDNSSARHPKRGRRKIIWEQVVKKKMHIQELCKNMIGPTNFGIPDVERGANLRLLLKVGLF